MVRGQRAKNDKNGSIPVIIADDHPLFLLGLRTFLERQGGFKIVGEASNAEQILEHARRAPADIVIMDLSIARSTDFKVIQRLRELNPQVKVLVLTGYATPEWLVKSIRAGVSGYLSKESDPSLLLLALREMRAGKPWIQREIMEQLLKALTDDAVPGWRALSRREVEVLKLMVRGLSNKEIAYRLKIRPGTVKEHVSRIYRKLNVRNRSEAVLKGLQMLGLFEALASDHTAAFPPVPSPRWH